ncbi:hypothetical protein EC988_000221 [Linderina pennispora]|nr:hypothetical protein EC988_000221 [Linderina pennispora]
MATMSELHAGYIALTDSASGDEAKESLYDSDHGGVDFRTLDGMAKATPRPCKAPRQLQSDPVHGQLRAKIAIFEAKLNSDKHDVDAWISYIGLQEQVAMSAFTKRMRGNVAIARMQIEMFQRAIGLNPKSKRLWTEYLMRCQDVLETTELLAEWIKALSETEDPDMIFSYVDFCQGAYSSSEMALAKANTIGTALESEWLGKEIEYSQECNEPLTIPALDIPTEPTNMFDPFAVTLFEDIEPFLADIPWDKDVFAVLLDNLFRFLGDPAIS